MNATYKVILSIHGLLGLAALISYWMAVWAVKGSPRHRSAGKFYMLVMLGLVFTALPMAAILGYRGNVGIAVFLIYLVVITAASMYLGWYAIQRKRAQSAYYDHRHLQIAWFNVLAAVTVLAVGWKVSSLLLMGFSLAGFSLAAQMLYRHYRPLQSGRWWLQEHYVAMLGCGVATHIAFLAIGLNRIVRTFGLQPPGWYNLIAWFMPLVVANIVAVLLNRKYLPRTAPPQLAA
jgi:uncharacterized membrane protein